jgi:hypothetical protein
MLHSVWDNDEFAGFDPLMMVAEIHAEAAFDYEEHFVFVLVVMKYEFAFELIELHVLAIEFGGDVGLPVLGDFGKFFRDVYFWHGTLMIGLSFWLDVEWMILSACWSLGIFGKEEIGRVWFGWGGRMRPPLRELG